MSVTICAGIPRTLWASDNVADRFAKAIDFETRFRFRPETGLFICNASCWSV
jgi:hypothetical protein